MAALAAQGAPLEEILGDHEGYPESICAHPADHDRHAETVAAVVADPARRALRIAFGPPCRTEFHAYHA